MCKPVTCSSCGRLVKRYDAVAARLLKTVDGDESNLTPANLMTTDEIVYQCHLCVQVECLEYPPLLMQNARFQQGYNVGMEEAGKRYNTWASSLTDEEVVSCLKGLFAAFASEGNEEVLYYHIGTTVGRLVGIATMPVIDAYAVSRLDGKQASS